MGPKQRKRGPFNLFAAARGRTAEKTLLVMTGTSCDNDCLFCSARGIPSTERSTGEITRELMLNRGLWRSVEFLGGEFTLRRDAIPLIRLCRRLGFSSVGVETNGKSFSNRRFTGEILAAGLNWASFSIHGVRPETHDSITRVPGSHFLSMRGLAEACRAAENRPFSICINFVVTKTNFREMPAMARAAARLGKVDSLCFSFVRPVPAIPDRSLKKILPRFSDARPFLEKALEFPFATARSFPPCLADPERIEDHREKLALEKNYGEMGDGGSCYASVAALLFKPAACTGCALNRACMGIWKRYARLYGTAELRPMENEADSPLSPGNRLIKTQRKNAGPQPGAA